MQKSLFAGCVGLLLLSGCGGNPAGPDRRPTGLTIVAPSGVQGGVFFLGQTYTFAANLQRADGTSTPVTGTWGSDAPSVATVQNGQVQIVGVGEATIYVDAEGLRGTHRLKSTVHYDGELDGALRITGCSHSGVFAQSKACGEAPNGTLFGFTGQIAQNGLTAVATMDLGEWPAEPVTATINDAGELRFTSEHRRDDDGIEFVATAQWVFRPRGQTEIDGTAVWRARIIGLSGTWELRGTIVPMRRTSASPDSAQSRRLADLVRRFVR